MRPISSRLLAVSLLAAACSPADGPGMGDDDDGEEKASEALDTRMAVMPSLLVQQLHSVDDPGCASVTPGTIASTNLSLGARALGLGTATQVRPTTLPPPFLAPGG